MKWRVKTRKRGVKAFWNVMWQHSTTTSGWWADEILVAESAEQAAQRMLNLLNIEDHTKVSDRRIKMRVYGPIPEEYAEFMVGKTTKVEKI